MKTQRETTFSLYIPAVACISAGRLQVEGKHKCVHTLTPGVTEHVGVSVSSRAKHTQPSPRALSCLMVPPGCHSGLLQKGAWTSCLHPLHWSLWTAEEPPHNMPFLSF